MEHFDLVVLGGGPAGYTAAAKASSSGMRTLLFESDKLGGVCLNEGCIPTKVMLNSSKLLYYAKNGAPYGILAGSSSGDGGDVEFHISHQAVLARKEKAIRTLAAGVRSKLKTSGATVSLGRAAITGKVAGGFALTQLTGDESGRQISAERILVATGSSPSIPPISGIQQGLESDFVMTSSEALSLIDLPKKLVIVGGGVIGLELADYYVSTGASVTIVEILNRVAYPMEFEVSKILMMNLQKKGVKFMLGCELNEIILPGAINVDGGNAGVLIKPVDGNNGTENVFIQADKVLIAIGRKPNVSDIGLEELGVYVERGAIVTDDFMRTNVHNIYAAGDVNGKSMLAHTAYREAECAVAHMLGNPDKMNYHSIPSIIYTNPEVAGVGETEESAATKGLTVKTIKIPMRYSGRYIAETESGDGICKIVFDTKKDTIIGVHIIGSYASEIILAAQYMIESRHSVDALLKTVFAHPTIGEILREAMILYRDQGLGIRD